MGFSKPSILAGIEVDSDIDGHVGLVPLVLTYGAALALGWAYVLGVAILGLALGIVPVAYGLATGHSLVMATGGGRPVVNRETPMQMGGHVISNVT